MEGESKTQHVTELTEPVRVSIINNDGIGRNTQVVDSATGCKISGVADIVLHLGLNDLVTATIRVVHKLLIDVLVHRLLVRMEDPPLEGDEPNTVDVTQYGESWRAYCAGGKEMFVVGWFETEPDGLQRFHVWRAFPQREAAVEAAGAKWGVEQRPGQVLAVQFIGRV